MTTNDKKLLNQQQPPAASQPAQPLQNAMQQPKQTQPAATQQPMQSQQPAQTQAQNQPQTQPQQSDVSSLMNMPGVSDTTKQTLGGLVTNGYKPSSNVTAAMGELQEIIAQQPAAFQSQHLGELNNIINQLLGRKTFSYDMSNDPFYQNYRQMYMTAGKQAMGDTVGQMSALTGGYGNSWAATAGQQQYNQYLQQLNDRIPELQQMALDRYNAEGDLLQMKYGMLGDAYNREYGEWQDQYNRWADDRDFAQSNYYNERDFDYGRYSDDVGNWFAIAGMENDQGNADRDYYYDWAMTQIENGQMPSAETLIMAGLTEEEVRALLGGGSSGGSGGSSSGGSGGKSNQKEKDNAAKGNGGKIPTAVGNANSNAGLASLLRGEQEQAQNVSPNTTDREDINQYRKHFKVY